MKFSLNCTPLGPITITNNNNNNGNNNLMNFINKFSYKLKFTEYDLVIKVIMIMIIIKKKT